MDIPSSVAIIEQSAFAFCNSLNKITFGENSALVTIEESSFISSTSLESIDIPESVKFIQQDAFGECTALSVVSIHSSTIIIDDNAFKGCPSVKINK